MTKRRKWTAIPGLVALALAAVSLSAYSGASSSQGNSPTQPIAFPHTVHVKTLGINCIYCHYTANKSYDAGMPAVGTCMGCHTMIGPDRPKNDLHDAKKSADIQKLWDFYKGGQGKPVPWVRIHKLPEYVHFPHVRHVNAGVTCQTCHGQIQNVGPGQVSQFASLNMGWCVNCHVQGYSPKEGLEAAGYAKPDTTSLIANTGPAPAVADTTRKKARYDCGVCHY